eukprot:TRINITY_DN20766_c0_g1_i1.p1 TRINITY_DN20766_c0_g1~~TRINITY_DN20766_c0_g1_i1.p1  ORF type:complete len:443 (+),score=147.13 TRINITY_DN20766_c0_g1_i1:90-1418(+)
MAEVAQPPDRPKNTKEWAMMTQDSLVHTHMHNTNVCKLLDEMEKAEADRLEAAERARQRELARLRAEEARRKREAREAAERRFKAEQAATMAARKGEAKAAKKQEAAELKAATAKFKQMAYEEYLSVTKQKQMFNIEGALKRVGAGVFACQNASHMLFGQLMVSEMRMKVRGDRPGPDNYDDYVHKALLKEQATLQECRSELKALATEGGEVNAALKKIHVFMTTADSRAEVTRLVTRASSLPQLNTTPKIVQMAVSSFDTNPDTAHLIRESKILIKRALELADKSTKAVAETTELCKKAEKASNKCLDRRKMETKALRDQVEKERSHAETTISDAAQRIAGLMNRIKFSGGASPRTLEATEQQLQAARTMLADLTACKARLDEEYRNKTACFKIDDMCRTMTRTRAGVHTNQKLDPISPSGGAAQSVTQLRGDESWCDWCD